MTKRSTPFRIGRRSFVRISASSAAGLYLAACDSGDPYERVRALVIGSGFGGGIAALRLAEAGIDVVVLERGRRWDITETRDTFTTTQTPDARAAWMHRTSILPGYPPVTLSRAPYVGLLQRLNGRNMDVICAAGVGGGSLVYSGIMIQPPRAPFESVFPTEVSYDEMDSVWYPRVKAIMQPGSMPDAILASPTYSGSRVFLRDAEEAGLDVERNECAFNWDLVQAELDGTESPQAILGDYLYGLNSGAKHSIDRIGYLPMAEATGRVEIRPLHQVTSVGQLESGAYYADVQIIDERGMVMSEERITADSLFMGAGSMNTTKLMLKAKAEGTLPNLNDQVGQAWGNNGQRILVRGNIVDETGASQGGPAQCFIHHHDNPEGPIGMEFGPAPIGGEQHLLVLATQGVPDTLGSLALDEDGEIEAVWDRNNDASAGRAARETIARLNSTAAGGEIISLGLLDDPSISFHPLGGMTMGHACDAFGRVLGHQHLYVVDSALIGGSTPAGNPFWTIAANAERCLDTIVREDFAGED